MAKKKKHQYGSDDWTDEIYDWNAEEKKEKEKERRNKRRLKGAQNLDDWTDDE